VNFQDIKMRVALGDALDLSRFEDGEFDTVLCMGPLYHLSDQGKQIKCLSECNRVLRPKGILAITYLNKNTHIEFGENPYSHGLEPDHVEGTLNELGFKIKEHVATDGVTPKIGKFINKLDEKDYKLWLNFNLSTCMTKAAVENTLHALVIAEKA
jgi:ubiquinone/menaquinone biosynthesis C-methylase UbiE